MKITKDFLEKYNKPGPRYTSYPPATSFTASFEKDDYIKYLINSNNQKPENISFYIHIPFCPQRCFFCGCNTTALETNEKIKKYIECLIKEIENVTEHIDKKRKVTQIHFGGGTPNSVEFKFLKNIIEKIKSIYTLSSNCEIAIECNPAYLELNDIDDLAKMGFNRISFGIQDFNAEVLSAVNRKPSKYPVEQIIERTRKNNFKGINIDLIYGLPLQTPESFENTIKKTIGIYPNRIVTFSYAHVPWFNEEQKKLEKYKLPLPEEKLSMLATALNLLTENGYEFIGMDHYAKSTDELAIAKKEKKLHRNFQGYCTKETTGQVLAFGASAISQLAGAYSQNFKNPDKYISLIENTGFATERGYTLTNDDKIRREIINEIMCNGYIDFTEIAKCLNFSVYEVKNAVDFSSDKFKEFENDKLLTIKGDFIQVSETGMLVVRNIAMAFDPLLKIEDNKYSKTV
ncbi:MAG: oxygen-independent coproporphyrinogen III oxidase [Bacteroidales bacterium]|nr:oxygen-independent coproporphyrinogen III oxidase [Bacteroidales bacterium]